jgi:hypothetical protein
MELFNDSWEEFSDSEFKTTDTSPCAYQQAKASLRCVVRLAACCASWRNRDIGVYSFFFSHIFPVRLKQNSGETHIREGTFRGKGTFLQRACETEPEQRGEVSGEKRGLFVTGAVRGQSRREEFANTVHSGQEAGREPV